MTLGWKSLKLCYSIYYSSYYYVSIAAIIFFAVSCHVYTVMGNDLPLPTYILYIEQTNQWTSNYI